MSSKNSYSNYDNSAEKKQHQKMHPRTALIMVPTRARTACRTRARTVPGIALKTSIRTRQRMITAIVTDETGR